MRRVARLLDDAVAIPGTGIRVGLDPLLGLVPGLGDVAGALASLYIVLGALRLGAPSSVVARMLANVAVDSLLGSIPVLGDLFDFGWKSNRRNVELLERFTARPAATTRGSRLLLGAVIVVGAAIVVAIGWGMVALVRAIGR